MLHLSCKKTFNTTQIFLNNSIIPIKINFDNLIFRKRENILQELNYQIYY